MKKVILFSLFLFIGWNTIQAESVTILTPASITVDLQRPEMFDEVVLLYKNVPEGDYQFRFRNISKPDYESLEICEDGGGIFMDYYLSIISLRTSGKMILSAKGAETAEVRLMKKPYKSRNENSSGITLPIGPECSIEPPISKNEWLRLMSEELNTDWTPLVTVKTAKNLIIRIEKEAYGYAEAFELAVVSK